MTAVRGEWDLDVMVAVASASKEACKQPSKQASMLSRGLHVFRPNPGSLDGSLGWLNSQTSQLSDWPSCASLLSLRSCTYSAFAWPQVRSGPHIERANEVENTVSTWLSRLWGRCNGLQWDAAEPLLVESVGMKLW